MPGSDRLVGHPTIQVVGQCLAGGIAVFGPVGHRLKTDRLQRRVDAWVELARRPELALLRPAQQFGDILTLLGRLSGQEIIKRGTQTIDIRSRPEVLKFAVGLLGAHVGRRAQGAAG